MVVRVCHRWRRKSPEEQKNKKPKTKKKFNLIKEPKNKKVNLVHQLLRKKKIGEDARKRNKEFNKKAKAKIKKNKLIRVGKNKRIRAPKNKSKIKNRMQRKSRRLKQTTNKKSRKNKKEAQNKDQDRLLLPNIDFLKTNPKAQ